ncbi:hypothetical protein CEXT_524611 [Caerostris extrusa]|uniref:Uncharacterized protein n=1 Tax=Caerostris extrusa TaxID=172846 RepID=A0AAV4SW70_CAEEX|nr:hypothetical protein CEXT_524611 [Caerostris extrusa]
MVENINSYLDTNLKIRFSNKSIRDPFIHSDVSQYLNPLLPFVSKNPYEHPVLEKGRKLVFGHTTSYHPPSSKSEALCQNTIILFTAGPPVPLSVSHHLMSSRKTFIQAIVSNSIDSQPTPLMKRPSRVYAFAALPPSEKKGEGAAKVPRSNRTPSLRASITLSHQEK